MSINSIQYKHREFDRVLQIEWTLGNTCNYSCSYCSPSLHDNSFPWIDLAASKKFIDRIYEHYGSLGIEHYIWKFGGGEPTLYKSFPELCAYINAKPNSYIIPITNGSRKLDWWRANAENFFIVHFSVHPEFADAEHIMEVCDYLFEQGVNSFCHVMIKPDEYDRCMEIIETLKRSRHSGWGIQAKPLHHIWATETADERELFPYTEEQKKIFTGTIRNQVHAGKMAGLKINRDMTVTTDEGTRDFDPYWAVTHEIVDWRGFHCMAGINRIYINYDKRVYLGAGCRVDRENFTGLTYDDPSLEFPSSGVICKQERCVCIADVQVPKRR